MKGKITIETSDGYMTFDKLEDFTETRKFKLRIMNLKEKGASDEFIKEYTELSKRFDQFGSDKETSYVNTVCAYINQKNRHLYEKCEEIMKIYGQNCEQIDAWISDEDSFILARCAEEPSFYYAKVNERYEYEFDHKPSRDKVEDTHLDNISQIALDEYEYNATEDYFAMYIL